MRRYYYYVTRDPPFYFNKIILISLLRCLSVHPSITNRCCSENDWTDRSFGLDRRQHALDDQERDQFGSRSCPSRRGFHIEERDRSGRSRNMQSARDNSAINLSQARIFNRHPPSPSLHHPRNSTPSLYVTPPPASLRHSVSWGSSLETDDLA